MRPRGKKGQKAKTRRRLQGATKDDINRIISEIRLSQEKVISEVSKIPTSERMESIVLKQIVSPLQEFMSGKLSGSQAVKQQRHELLSGSQAVKQQRSLDDIVSEMKVSLESLSPRHTKILGVLAQNRDEWLSYSNIGSLCAPPLTGSCIRGYVADLINLYKIPVEKKNFGRQSKVRVPEKVWKTLLMTKLAD